MCRCVGNDLFFPGKYYGNFKSVNSEDIKWIKFVNISNEGHRKPLVMS